MYQRINAFDIGGFNIKVVSGQVTMKRIDVSSASVFPTPEGLVVDGLITEPQVLAEYLRGELSQIKRFSKEIIATVTSKAIIIRDINVPKVNSLEFTRMMRHEAIENLPVTLDDHIIDYKIIEEVNGENGAEYRVMLVAIPRNIVSSYLEFLRAIGMDCKGIDFAGNSVSKLIVRQDAKEKFKKTTAVLDLGHTSSAVTIMHRGAFKYYRIFSHGVGELSLEFETLDKLLEEIKTFFDFYMSRESGNTIDKITILGGGALIEGVIPYIEQKLLIPINLWQTRGVVRLSREARMGDNIVQFANAIGALR
ncbi:MAG: pilus assembly protein PilM [Clostridiales bacterium]|jgi:type IV pilus assembly protein PilM|nr:pilus assembly protein PilM [Clostridiales bacterium]